MSEPHCQRTCSSGQIFVVYSVVQAIIFLSFHLDAHLPRSFVFGVVEDNVTIVSLCYNAIFFQVCAIWAIKSTASADGMDRSAFASATSLTLILESGLALLLFRLVYAYCISFLFISKKSLNNLKRNS